MPVRKRADKRAGRADFPVSVELAAAFHDYIDSDPVQPDSCWPEYRDLADLLEEAGAPVEPLLGILCWHPRDGRRLMGGEMAVYRRLAGG